MPEFWQFPTVSMGLGPIGAIYQAKFLKYLEHRGLKDTSKTKPFTRSSATVKWTNRNPKVRSPSLPVKNWITWSSLSTVNLQRLDGPVTGNGKIINELEGIFEGAGWNVIKVMWGSRWMNCCVKIPAVN
ncbi:pyruvate dehydrogenase E1 component [Escherichia coli]|uniref:Pyruvate dehydrogenase E1 component n=1 Tax=Escherichia coli TaxID=562 RepID=A0A447X9S6_ECOLX|nr:pyruvate dehydrogenase E1 component [Escherichia coli]